MATPNRDAADRSPSDFDRAKATAAGQLAERGIRVVGDERAEDLADLLSAVEEFEGAVRARGGDSYTNAPDSSAPDNPSFVLPERADDESAPDYTARVRTATSRIEGRLT